MGSSGSTLDANQHYDGTIWELLVLHACLRRFKNVVPEPAEGMPDVIVKRCWRTAFSVEATTISSPESELLDLSSEFHSWIYRRIAKSSITLDGATISTEATAGYQGKSEVPKRHRWRQLTKHSSWSEFVNEVLRSGRAIWRCPEGGISVFFQARNNGFITGNLFAPEKSTEISKHPVYRAIRSKAKQASNWPNRIRRRPIVLAMCAPRSGSEFSDFPAHNEFSVDRAIWSALLDHERLSDLDRLNVLRQKLSFSPEGVQVVSNRLRVAGSKRISAVLFVRIEQNHDRAQVTPVSRAIPMLYINKHADVALTARHLIQIKQLDFNFLKYGPGWEAWHGSPRESRTTRNMRRGGGIEFRLGKEGNMEMRIPTIQLMKVLSGESSAQEVFSGYGEHLNPIEKFRKALNAELLLQSVSVINPDAGSRNEQCVAFVFGRGEESIVARSKNAD